MDVNGHAAAAVPQELPPELAPHPIPLGFGAGVVRDGAGKPWAVLQFAHALGQTVIHMDAETLDSYVRLLREARARMRGGLVIPDAPLPGPGRGDGS